MRKSTLLLLLALAACGEGESGEYVVIDDFLGRSPRLACEARGALDHMAVTRLRAASDSTVMVMDGPGRRLVELAGDLRTVWELELPSVGPGAVNAPVGIAVVNDTAIAIAERQGLQLIIYARSGQLIRATPLGFAPAAVVARPSGEVLVTAMPFGETPASLVFRYDSAGFHEMPVAPRPFTDMFVGALGNTTLAEAMPDGAVLVVHQYMAPRAFRVGADGRVDRLRLPTPDATREKIDYVPVSPMVEEQLDRVLVPALAMSVDSRRSELYVMTRTGRRLEGGTERAILRLGAGLEFLESFILDFRARHMAIVPSEQTAIIVDDEDRFHVCDFRRLNGRAGAE